MENILEYLKTVFVQIVCIYFWQSLTFVLSVYAFTRTKIAKKPFFMGTLIFMIGTYLIRLLPIQFGVHTLLSLILLIFLGLYILKLPIYSSVKATLVSTVILLMTEGANIVILKIIFSEAKFVEMMKEPITKAIVGIPGNILFLLIIILFYRYLTREKTDEKVK